MFRAIAQGAFAVRANPLRSSLGALAIAVAVATMLLVSVALNGIRSYAELTTARTFGSDTFLIAQVASAGRISRKQLQAQLARNPPVSRVEVKWLARYGNDITIYAPNAQTRADVSLGSKKVEAAPITGTTAAITEIRDLNVVDGTFFTEADDAAGNQVAIIGAEIVDGLFDGKNPVGGAIRIAGRRFQVIGVQGRVGSGGTGSIDKYVWIPMRAYERAFGAPRSLQVFAKGAPGVGSTDAEDHARISLRAARSLAPGTADTFDVLAPEAARSFVANLSSRIGAAAGPISIMALLAAIVVITNTVLVSVTQRTREIGLRRALGARRNDIVGEVLAESTLLALAGGVAGTVVVLALVTAVSSVAPVPLSIPPTTLVLALAAAAASGILAGWLPAVRATRLDVITAIRAE